MRITNNTGISLPLAVWLVHDEYDYVEGVDNYMSVTTLMRPLKQIILPSRIPPEARTSDVADYVARKLGNAIHDSIERAWERGAHRAMRLMGYPEEAIQRIIVNPNTEQRRNIPDMIPVYLENRGYREIIVDGVMHTLGGKFDMVADGILGDNKSSSAWSWVFGTRDEEHRLQMSMYRWIDAQRTDGDAPRITEEICNVNYIFTDWQKMLAKTNPKYPQSRVEQKTLRLLSLDETETWIRNKISLVHRHLNATEAQMPQCSDEELWRSAPSFKYFSDPEKAKLPGARSTKNFETLHEANAHLSQMGKGVVKTIPGEVKACGFCPAFDICQQKEAYFV
jgi:hypothetical protein